MSARYEVEVQDHLARSGYYDLRAESEKDARRQAIRAFRHSDACTPESRIAVVVVTPEHGQSVVWSA